MKKHLSLIITVLMLFGILYPMPDAYAGGNTVHYIAVSSDRHNTADAIACAMTGMPAAMEYVCLNGDMTDAEHSSGSHSSGGKTQMAYNTGTVAAEVRGVFPDLDNDHMSIIYGSHDANATDDAGIMKCISGYEDTDTKKVTTSGADSDAVSAGQSGLIFEGPDGDDADALPDYYIYGVSFYDMQKAEAASVATDGGSASEIPDSGGKAAAAKFMIWIDALNETDPDAPVIVIGHVPLHYKRGDNFGAVFWNDAFNYAATGSTDGTEIRREVAYLHGHNHTVESTEYYVEPGSELELQGSAADSGAVSAVIRYTYATGGYLRDNHTATLIKVDGSDLTFTKYKGCIISFDATGGSEVAPQTVQKGKKITKPADPSRDGWVFTGWYTETACENAFDFSSCAEDDMTLYAGWIRGSKPKTPSLTASVKASKKLVRLSWAKDASASDFRIFYRKAGAGTWTRKWTNGNTSYNVTGLKKKGLYQFRVSAAAESGDRMIYSDSSAVRCRYISALSEVKVKAKKKAFRVSWKKDSKADAYQIKYSTKKNMKNAVTVSAGRGKSAKLVKKLRAGKKYYVRVRPVVSYGGNTYYGAWSARKAVKTK